MKLVQKYSTFIFDLDGTIYIDEKIIQGAAETIRKLSELGKELLFISNKTIGAPADYNALLKKNKIHVKVGQIINLIKREELFV